MPIRTATTASREYTHQVETDLRDLISADTADHVADYIVAELERIGGSDARLVFLTDGTGPFCSWCWFPNGLCRHIAGGASEHIETPDSADTRPAANAGEQLISREEAAK